MKNAVKLTLVAAGFIVSTSSAFAHGRYINDNRSYVNDRSITNNDNRQINRSRYYINDNRKYINDRSVTNNDNRTYYYGR